MTRTEGFCLTVVVPCYNAESYMARAVDSVLSPGFGDVELILVNDGSRDRTEALAEGYARANPGRVRAVHQENRGHGGAVNTGIALAQGAYLKVLDSDDWFDLPAFRRLVETLRMLLFRETPVDALVSNYVYEKQGARRKKTMHYRRILSRNKILTWDQVGRFPAGKYLMMHSLTYRTQVLRESGLRLPEHTYYVDNLFVCVPMRRVHSLYYLDEDLYRYYIGRDDQSVNESVMIRRIDQQLRVNTLVIENFLRDPTGRRRLEEYLFHHLEIVTAISSVLLIKAGTPEHTELKDTLWQGIAAMDPGLYRRLHRRGLGVLVNLPGLAGKLAAATAYGMTRLLFGFN